MRATWKPFERHGRLTRQSDLPASVFAFPKLRKEPLTDASHVRNAVARFDQVIGVSDADRELAFSNIKKAARHYGIEMSERSATERAAARRSRSRTAAPSPASAGKTTTIASTPARSAARKRSYSSRANVATSSA